MVSRGRERGREGEGGGGRGRERGREEEGGGGWVECSKGGKLRM